jgi:mannose-1-phosphate guanylyltransferase
MVNTCGKPLKSLILSAGHGTRLRPLTDTIPKPLATICGVPLLEAALFKAKQAGATSFAINTHHLHHVIGAKLPEICKNLHLDRVFISHEPEDILGTGGALVALKSWWGDDRLLVYNGDILSDMDLNQLVASHDQLRPLVTIAVRSEPPKDGGRSVWVDDNGYVHAICLKKDLPQALESRKQDGATSARAELREFGFACAYIAEPHLLEFLPKKPAHYDLISGFQSALRRGEKINAVNHNGYWADVGTPFALWKTNLDVAKMSSHERQKLLGRDLSSDLFAFGSNNVISPTSNVHPQAKINNTVLLEGASVESIETLINHIRGFGLNHAFEPQK